ncbi:unnamed protein product, partial [Staurois parvus]
AGPPDGVTGLGPPGGATGLGPSGGAAGRRTPWIWERTRSRASRRSGGRRTPKWSDRSRPSRTERRAAGPPSGATGLGPSGGAVWAPDPRWERTEVSGPQAGLAAGT